MSLSHGLFDDDLLAVVEVEALHGGIDALTAEGVVSLV